MRIAAGVVVLIVALAGCGSSATTQEHSSVQPDAVAKANVFTVPDKLPPRAKAPVVRHNPDTTPEAVRSEDSSGPRSGAPSDAEVQRELAKALGLEPGNNPVDQAGLTEDGFATVPPSAPAKVAAIINAANQVAHAPYRYGGGHGGVGGEEIWVDSAYDCSASVSFALASAKLVKNPLDSTSFMRWGRPGPGKWVTVFANAGHAFMVVAGLRYDTVERSRTGTRWGEAYRSVSGFVARHPEGL